MTSVSDLDLHLFGEGTHRRLWELLGPEPGIDALRELLHAVRSSLRGPAQLVRRSSASRYFSRVRSMMTSGK